MAGQRALVPVRPAGRGRQIYVGAPTMVRAGLPLV
jgi:hypothetical protein